MISAMMIAVFRYVGIILIIVSIILMIRLKRTESNGLEVAAVVVNVKENKVRTGRQVYDEFTPILEYTIADTVYRSDALTSQGDQRYEMGQVVRIRYQPDNPEDVMVVGDRRYFFNAAIIGTIGVLIEILTFLIH